MNTSQPSGEGFDPHVMDQLQHLASEATPRGRGQPSRKRGKVQYQKFDFRSQQHPFPPQQPHIGRGSRSFPRNQPYGQSQPVDQNSFPPLGSTQNPPLDHQASFQHSLQLQPGTQSHGQQQLGWQTQTPPVISPQGHWNGRYEDHHHGGFSPPAAVQYHTYYGGPDDFMRPQPSHGRLFQPGGARFSHNVDQQQSFQYRKLTQSDFLNSIAGQALENQISPEEFREKENFRQIIEDIAKKAILTNRGEAQKFDIESVKLKLYGSLGSGFAVTGSDMDLLLSFPQLDNSLEGIDIESRRWIEKALLDAGYGARLLTNTRVPILKVCQKPSTDLLERLRDYRQQWEYSIGKGPAPNVLAIREVPLPPFALASTTLIEALQEISLEALQVPLPDVSQDSQPNLEFVGDCGIQCDVNFTHYVALRNTELLRTYGLCDPRVRQMGLFVKHWAKARNINTPYKGTLSSYGYVMLVLHYLMNVVNPPLIPNLQVIAKEQDGWARKTEIETIEGFDVRFVRDPEQLQNIMANMQPNHDTIGSLLRGFFLYYACNGGFHWTRDVVSIRTRGGQITKYSKGWTGAKWSESKQNVRLRYLLAIEDPFETEHNIGRTVGHSGIVAIRDEFRRAWSIIEHVQYDQMQNQWVWIQEGGGEVRDAEELMEAVHNRGDLLRKDQIDHKDRMRQMRKEADRKEQALRDNQLAHGETDLQSLSPTTDSTTIVAAAR